MQRYEFLVQLHDILRPKVYLETGVQHGTSLNLAVHSERAFGIDPQPLIQASGNQTIVPFESDAFFVGVSGFEIDLGFVDGLHTFDQALRDFFNMQRLSAPGAVIAFDDVLPYTQQVGLREPQLGDWAGDVYKVIRLLPWLQPKLQLTVVNVWPTGLLLVENLDPGFRPTIPLTPEYLDAGGSNVVPDEIINRTEAHDPEVVLERLRKLYTNGG